MAHRKRGYARKIPISNQKNLRESVHTQNIEYLCLNPKRKACIMCWCSHRCYSLAALSHLRKGKEPLPPSPPSPKHPLPAAASKGHREDETLGCPSGAHQQLLPTQRDAFGNCHHLTWGVLCVFFPSRKCLPLSYHPLCQGVHPRSRILAKVASPPHLPVRQGSNEAPFCMPRQIIYARSYGSDSN